MRGWKTCFLRFVDKVLFSFTCRKCFSSLSLFLWVVRSLLASPTLGLQAVPAPYLAVPSHFPVCFFSLSSALPFLCGASPSDSSFSVSLQCPQHHPKGERNGSTHHPTKRKRKAPLRRRTEARSTTQRGGKRKALRTATS